MFCKFDRQARRIGKITYVSEHSVIIGDVANGDDCYIAHCPAIRADCGSEILSLHSGMENESVNAEGAAVKKGQKVPSSSISARNPARGTRGFSKKDTEF